MKKKIPTAIRMVVFKRDNYRCRGCGLGDRRQFEADHVIPESMGGETSPDNLITLCGACNRVKGTTIVRDLPILPPVKGFGDHNDILARFESFVNMVRECRKSMLTDAANMLRVWKTAGVSPREMRHRLPPLVGNRNVRKVVFLAFKNDPQTYREVAPR